MQEREVAEIVRRYLTKHGGDSLAVSVLEEGIHRWDDWWYVPVYIPGTQPRTYQYYDVLAEAEGELEEVEQINVLLVPAAAPEPA
jgi:hypothetical protein